ncbi:MAG: beta-galactosidase [Ardenticatenia bacterium]|nr:beta-galactosidase [Ardenticatenia bacterium]
MRSPVGVHAATPAAEQGDHRAMTGVSSPSSLYLPLTFRNYPPQPSIFGVEISRGSAPQVITRVAELKPGWVRINGLSWWAVEAQRGVYDWSQVATLEKMLADLGSQGMNVSLVIAGTPEWAQKVPGYRCGPIQEEALRDFKAFVAAAVRRYSEPPYNVRFWEFWNEPDVAYQIAQPMWPFGCLGDLTAPYYGGGYYARMLEYFYSAVKETSPRSRVIFGGLLIDCDPENPPPGKDCSSGRFLEGVLRNGGAAYFDILAYHAYPHWSKLNWETLTSPADWDLLHPSWRHRGGIFLGKLDFLREVLARYGVTKPILMNEGGLLCHPLTPDCNEGGAYQDEFRDDQANYVVRLYVRGWANGLDGVVWYTLNGPGWRQGGLLDENQQPRPAYTTMKFLVDLFDGAKFEMALPTGTDLLEAYVFRQGQKRIYVYWRNDDNVTSLELPDDAVALYSYRGEQVNVTSNGVAVGFEPVIVVAGPAP